MKIIVIGGTGTLGTAITKQLSLRNEVIVVGRHRGTIQCDISSEESIHQLYKKVGIFHAVVVAAGEVHFEEFAKMTSAKYQVGLSSKLMGQVNVVLIGRDYIQDGGSFTLTSGILSDDPIRAGSSASMVSGAINSFVRGAAIEMPRGLRINAVSSTLVKESEETLGAYFPGFETVPAEKAALAYVKSVEGLQTGQVYRVGF